MDIYRLLTRSTNIQKSRAETGKISHSQIPSAGHLTYSDAEYDEHVEPPIGVEPTQRGTKRKRIGSVEGQGTIAPGSLSFFAPAADVVTQVKKPRISGSTSSSHMQIDKPHLGSATHNEPVPTKEERWRALKQHKLKITVIEDARVTGKETDSSRPVRSRHKDSHLAIQPLLSFELLRARHGISRRLAENLDAQGYKHPTEVQMGSLPILLGSDEDRDLANIVAKGSKKGFKTEVDLLTVAPTGSGKTLAFMIHVIHDILEERRSSKIDRLEGSQDRHVRAVILAPTHELADQIVNEGRKLAAGTGLRVSALRKGLKLHIDRGDVGDPGSEEHTEGVDGDNERDGSSKSSAYVKSDILVSTPLLLLHAISEATPTVRSLPNVRYLILDEADYLLDPLFREQTLSIWNACICPSLRVSLWSATIGSSIESLAQSFILERRQKLGLKAKHHRIIRLVVGLKDSSIPNISHRLIYAASEQGKLLALRQLLHPTGVSSKDVQPLQPPFLIFTQTIPRAIALHSELLYDIPTQAGGASRLAVLHSDLSNAARASIMTGFRKGEIWILITTDLLSRGVDFRGMNGIVNYDIPNSSASYIHRAGRTGRQGREGGVAVTLYTKEDRPYLKGIANVIAASEKLKGGKTNPEEETKGLQKWLLDALPDISKKTKKELKVKGVENRRTGAKQEGGREARRTRISTKSGYDRRMENRKKGATISSQQQHGQDVEEKIFLEDEDWAGFND